MKLRELIRELERYAQVDPDKEIWLVVERDRERGLMAPASNIRLDVINGRPCVILRNR